MSGIQGVSGSGIDIYAILMQAQSQKTTTSNTSSTAGAQSSSENSGGIDDLKSKIDAAIAEALANLDKSSTAQEIMAAIKDAVDETLTANGIDPTAMKDVPPPPPPPTPADEDDEDDSTETDGVSGSRVDDLATTLRKLLEENGFDPDAIKAELLANQDSQGNLSSGYDMIYRLLTSSGVNTQA